MSDIQELKFDKKNFNKHTEHGMRLLENSLRSYGAGRSILVDKDNNIIAGNGIVESAINAGITKTRVVETTGDELVVVKRKDVLLDSQQGREMALADNATAAADLNWDQDNLREVFTDEQLGAWDIKLEWEEEKEIEEDVAPEVEPEEPAESQAGKIYALGEHRLLCGDATKPEDVEKLMAGEQADLWLTDPPYNVDYEGGTGLKIQNDNMENAAFRKFLEDSFFAAKNSLKPGGAFYIWHADSEGFNFRAACQDNGLTVRECLIWNKNSLVLGRQDYQWKHEPCLYGWKDGAAHYFTGHRDLTTVIEDNQDIDKMTKAELQTTLKTVLKGGVPTTVIDCAKPLRSAEHPTMKPVRLFAELIRNSSREKEKVLDTFAGSGTTMIACEQLGRKTYMMELDPHYCDVIRKRYWKFKTGSEEGWQDGTKEI